MVRDYGVLGDHGMVGDYGIERDYGVETIMIMVWRETMVW